MKYALLFAATASAYEAYGGYNAQSSSTPAKVSSAASAPGYGGYGSQPVTSSKASVPASKATPCSTSVGKNGYTVVTPGYGKPPVTVTSQYQSYPTCVAAAYDGKSCDKWSDDKYVSTTIVDYNKKTQTVTKKEEYITVYHEKKTVTHYATSTALGYGAVSTPVAKNSTGVWYELYEKVYVCEYQNMGKNAMVGYTGSGLCQKCDDEQPIVVKEYKNGKWTEEKKTMNYGKPKDEVKVYEKPGTYTVPAKTVTIYSKPTGKAPENNVYTYPGKTITITKSNQPYTCTYEIPKQTPSKTPSKNEEKVTKTPSYNDYGYATPTPKKPENNYGDYPSYPVKSNSTSVPVYGGVKPTPTPVYGNGYGYDNKPSSSIPSKASSTPCDDDKKKPTPTPYQPSYDNGNSYNDNNKSKPSPTPSNPSYDNGNNNKPTPTPYQPTYDNGNSYNDNNKPKPSPTPVYGNTYNNNNGGYGGDNTKPTPTPAYGAYPADKSGGYGSSTEYGKSSGSYVKRGGMIERRKAVAEAQEVKRAIVL
ncbi:hypothetical protein DE146DRAFT_662248 [Phaeosphaeria sp. MPI-PUGE-AT-0046c]|nr:hypothetical protein DE146DRAFT_662248 [Phaeosphaeria sp. MPI-PUGE-AT-0046c]